MNRREFGKLSGIGAFLLATGASILTTGCNALSDLLNWIPVGLQAVTSILNLLNGAGISLPPAVLTVVELIQVGLGDLKLAIVEYQSTTPPPAGALQKIDTFLAALVSNIGNILSQLPTAPNNVITLVIGLFELLLTTIQGFIASVPVAASLTKTRAVFAKPFMVRGQAVSLTPRTNLSRRAFIHSFNALTTAGGHKEANLPESLVQHL